MKKKAILSVITVVILALIITPIISFNIYNEHINDVQETEEDDYEEYIEEDEHWGDGTGYISSDYENENTTKDESKLSSNYILLYETTEANGNVWEIVGQDSENYQGSYIEIGIIKNNEWFINLSNDCPFINNGEINEFNVLKDNSEYLTFGQLSEGVFILNEKYQEIYWNTNNGKTLIVDCDTLDQVGFSGLIRASGRVENESNKIIMYTFDHYSTFGANRLYRYNMYFVDPYKLTLNKFESVITPIYKDDFEISQIQEGMFYSSCDFNTEEKCWTYYDSNGKKLFDLRNYDTESAPIQSLTQVENGKFIATNELNNGSKYELTFDKTGKLISQSRVEN